MSVKFEKIVKEDLNLGVGEVEVTMPGGGSAIGNKIGPHTFKALAFAASLESATQAFVGGSSPDSYALAAIRPYNVEHFDTGDWFDLTTGKFTPQVAGIYYVSAFASIVAFTGAMWVSLYKNDTWVLDGQVIRTAQAGEVQVSAAIELDGEDDYITARVNHNDGTNSRNIDWARFEAFLIGNNA